MKISLSSTNLLFRVRKTTQKIRLTMTNIFSFQIPSRQQSSPISPSCESPNTTLQGETTADRPLQVYRRRIQPDLTLLQAQESEPEQGNELSHSSLPIPDLDQPIAIRQGRRECTKNPLYPIANLCHFKSSHHHTKPL